TFYVAAEDVLPSDLLQTQDFGFLRGCALLAIASIQDAKINAMHKHIGIYFTILAIHQWHDEANWPANLSQVEREELRRLSMQLESYEPEAPNLILWKMNLKTLAF
ncbi:hypothetical protein DH86_00002113, partial [Scytalidium sp. 3C]